MSNTDRRDQEDLDWHRLYGPWESWEPAEVQALLRGLAAPWWVREHSQAPWVIDIPLSLEVGGRWQSKRDAGHVADLDAVTWVHSDGIRYSNPELVLLYKAEAHRPKDARDLDVTWPLLAPYSQRWLSEALARLYPGHPWIERTTVVEGTP